MKRIILTVIASLILASCASQPTNRSPEDSQARIEKLKQSPNTWNDAPSEVFSGFDRFEFNEPKLTAALQTDEKKVVSAEGTGEIISYKLNPVFEKWQKQGNGNRTLTIDSTFSQYKIVGGSARFWAGAFAGDSNVQIDVEMKDKATGKVIASPFFFQRANAFGAAWTFGSHDQSIPERLAVLMDKYMRDNYDSLEGGPTGNDE